MTEQELNVIAGLTIGDGCISCHFDRYIYTIIVCHSVQQTDYLQWKKSIMEKELEGSVREYYRTNRIVFRNAKTVKKAYSIFYPNGKKSAIPYLRYMKDARNLAMWFMDDGGLLRKKKRKSSGELYWLKPSMNLSTHCFSFDEVEVIRKFFIEEWGIIPLIHKDKGKYYRMYFNANESKKVWELIKEYVMQIPSMRDKFDLFIHFYENGCDNMSDYVNEVKTYSKLV